MPISFPASPALNATYTYNGKTWQWNGTTWVALGAVGPQGPKGDKGDTGSAGAAGAAGATGAAGAKGDKGDAGTTTVDGLTDATTVGKALAKATSAATARDAIGAYNKPAGGIPRSDLAATVFASVFELPITTTAANDATAIVPIGGSTFAVLANEVWIFSGFIQYQGETSDTDGDIKLAFIGPSGSTYSGTIMGSAANATGGTGAPKFSPVSGSGLQSFGCYGPTTPATVLVSVKVKVGANPGNIYIGFSKNAHASAGATSVLDVSSVVAAKVSA